MKKIMVLGLALLCIFSMPAMAHDEGDEPLEQKNWLLDGDNIWISISPMEAHPMYIDRPAPIIPTIPGYPIRVAVYSNPFIYSTLVLNETTGEYESETVVVEDESAMEFDVTCLDDFGPTEIQLRLPDADDPGKPADSGPGYSKKHTESDFKYEYVFYVRDLDYLDSRVERLFFVADNEVDYYQGSGLVKVTETSQSGGGSSGPKSGSGGGNSDKNDGNDNNDGSDDSNPKGPKQGGKK